MAPCGEVAGAVASMLCALGFAGVFCAPPSAGFCAEPIVVTQGAFAREARLAYGAARSCAGTELEVLGTWPTLPVMTLTATAGSAVKVADDAGRYVLVERGLSAGDEVVMDFASESVTVVGEDASADVGVGSTFFSLAPGAHVLTFSGCSAHEAAWTERWL